MKVLRVRMESRETGFEELPEQWLYLGGSALIARIMAAEVAPTVAPLGPENPLIPQRAGACPDPHPGRHLPHGRAAIFGLMAFVKANTETCQEQFMDMAFLIDRSEDLEESLRSLYQKLEIALSLKAQGISREALEEIAFYASRDAVNMATDPTTPSQKKILDLLIERYE